jgi:hypothetical protein
LLALLSDTGMNLSTRNRRGFLALVKLGRNRVHESPIGRFSAVNLSLWAIRVDFRFDLRAVGIDDSLGLPASLNRRL